MIIPIVTKVFGPTNKTSICSGYKCILQSNVPSLLVKSREIPILTFWSLLWYSNGYRIHVDIMTGEKVCQFMLLAQCAFIAQLVHPVGGE